jgi:very-short-patch-repair endonuclease
MAAVNAHLRARQAWRLAARQHGVIALFRLLALGYTEAAVRHRIAKGRLHVIYPGLYAVGRADLTRTGEWMAAVLTCAPVAVLSHDSAAALWGIRDEDGSDIHVSVPRGTGHRQTGIVAHRRKTLRPRDVTRRDSIPVTTPILTLIDLPPGPLEAAINKADELDLVDPPRLRRALDARKRQRGTRPLMDILDRSTFVLTDSDLERCLLPIAARAGLPSPQTQRHLNGFRVDFFWADLGLVVETDGLRYHRTAEQQVKDRLRDQAHIASGLTPLRFTHWQVRYDQAHVERTLRSVGHRLDRSADPPQKPCRQGHFRASAHSWRSLRSYVRAMRVGGGRCLSGSMRDRRSSRWPRSPC